MKLTARIGAKAQTFLSSFVRKGKKGFKKGIGLAVSYSRRVAGYLGVVVRRLEYRKRVVASVALIGLCAVVAIFSLSFKAPSQQSIAGSEAAETSLNARDLAGNKALHKRDNSLEALAATIEQGASDENGAQLAPSSAELSVVTLALYLEQSGDYKAADEELEKLSTPGLMGSVIAHRYLQNHYKPSEAELSNWLKSYKNVLPIAEDIAQLRQETFSGNRSENVSDLANESSEQMFIRKISEESSSLFGNAQAGGDYDSALRTGVMKWSMGQYAAAGGYFGAAFRYSYLANGADNAWNQSTAAFWLARAHAKIGRMSRAEDLMNLAATHNHTFYGKLALDGAEKIIYDDMQNQVDSSNGDAAVMSAINSPAMKRALVLNAAGMQDAAKAEIIKLNRDYLSILAKSEREKLYKQIADSFDLKLKPVDSERVQFRIKAFTPTASTHPLPAWRPDEGFSIDPALIYALIKRESSFSTTAESNKGAMGLMQLLPETAMYIKGTKVSYSDDEQAVENQEKRLEDMRSQLMRPEYNISMGQLYLKYLMRKSEIGNNLVFLSAAYNAGPGNLLKWKKAIRHGNDPLVFIESIPVFETREYVKRVIANYWYYSKRTATNNATLKQLASGGWPLYSYPTRVATASLNGSR